MGNGSRWKRALFLYPKRTEACNKKAKKKEVKIERKEFDYSLGEDNFLLLDNASLYCNGMWDECGYILGKDDKLRRKYGLDHYGSFGSFIHYTSYKP